MVTSPLGTDVVASRRSSAQATYNAQEPQAGTLESIYRTLGIPASQVHVLDLPVVTRLPHTDGVGNAAYAPLWREMLNAVKPQQP